MNLKFLRERDLEYEAEVKRNPYNLRSWLQYLDSKDSAPKIRFLLYERALAILPMSYKLWYRYLNERVDECRDRCIDHPTFEDTNNAFERALTFMHKMPRIWMMYGEFLTYQRFTTRTRKAFDEALKSLPITQHSKIWPLYLKFVRQINVPETAVRVYRRFVMLNPECREEFIDWAMENVKYLTKKEQREGQLDDMGEERKRKFLEQAAMMYIDLCNDDQFTSKKGKNKMKLWRELTDILCNHPEACKELNVDAIIRSGIRRYPDQIGWLWCQLAKYYIRLSQFSRARDIFEEAITTVATARDFEIAYDGYVKFEEQVILVKTEQLEAGEDDDEQNDDLDLRMERLMALADRQKLLISSVKLRQNPHNVAEWISRVKIFTDDCDPPNLTKAFETFSQAIKTVDPQKATGRPHTIWVLFAQFYEMYSEDIEAGLVDAREVFERAIGVNFRGVDDLASVWCEWAEMELRHKNYDHARKVLKRATELPAEEVLHAPKEEAARRPVQDRVFRSTKLWAFRVDVEEVMGRVAEVKSVYSSMVELEVSTPLNVLNFAKFLENNKYFEESFQAYEKGVALFGHPHVMPIWRTYLKKFIARYKGTKLERTRELFEQALKGCPPKSSKEFFLLYARVEETYGLARHAMRVYDRAVEKVAEEDKLEMFSIYINRAGDLFGVTRTREIYIKGIKTLPDVTLPEMSLRFVALERRLGEVDRAREIFKYGSQYTDPQAHTKFWERWQDFEIECGNEETYKEMRRIKRSVDAQYTHVRGQVADTSRVGEKRTATEAQVEQPSNPMSQLEEMVDSQAPPIIQDANEINLDELGKEEGDESKYDIETKEVPSAVFGSLPGVGTGKK